DLKYLLKLLWTGKGWILVTALLGLGLGFLATYLQTPIYRAQALVQIDPPGQNISALSNPYPATAFNWFDYQNYYNTQYRIITSKALARRAIEKLELQDAPPFKGASEPALLFISRVEVVPVPDTRLATIAVNHEDPQEAARWANTLAEAYLEQNLEAKIETTRNVYSWLQERLSAAETDVESSEQTLYEYTKEQGLFVPKEGGSIGAETLEKLNEEATEAKTRRIELESMLAQVEKARKSDGSLDSLPQIASDPLVQRLNMSKTDLEVELVQLKNRYKEGHPKVKQVLTQIDQIQEAIDAQSDKIVDGMLADYQQLRRRERELLASIDSQREETVEESRKTVQLEMLERDAVSNKSLYEAILQKIKETDIAASLRENNVSIVETAGVPVAPVKPQPVRNLVMALMLGLVSGCGFVLLRDYLDNTFKDQEDVEKYLKADCLAIIPKHDAAGDGVVTEAYRTLRSSLLFNRERDHGNVILLTSSIPQEGKSTTAINLARALAESGEPTLVVDFDLRRSSVHNHLRLYREPGLADYCSREVKLDVVMQSTKEPNLSAVTSGKLPPNPPALIGSTAVKRFLDECRERFTWILLDAPPIVSVTDPLLLAKLADMVLMVVRYNQVDRKLARRSLVALRRTDARVAGVVLNGIDPRSDSYHYYYSYYQERRDPEGKVTRMRRPSQGSPQKSTAAG
ncbi:MAG TPA: polysaccharide biosynthesis tyrosine autokinase, partial [Vicinamibacteria bacterium]|nr:polysaccharide biosynthesis tyrosine autokinase [Vicinamibacteria bacterium]